MMAIEANIKFNPPPLPVRDDGFIALVLLSKQAMAERGIEYHGDPVVVTRWHDKLNSTLGATRLSYDDVVGWMEFPEDAPK